MFWTIVYSTHQTKQLNEQFEVNLKNAEKQSHVDSILNRTKIELIERELILIRRQTEQDSINLILHQLENSSLLYQNKMKNIDEWIKLKYIYKKLNELILYEFIPDRSISKTRLLENDSMMHVKYSSYLNTIERQYKWAEDLNAILESGLSNHYLITHPNLFRQWENLKIKTNILKFIISNWENSPQKWKDNYDFNSHFESIFTQSNKLIRLMENEDRKISIEAKQ